MQIYTKYSLLISALLLGLSGCGGSGGAAQGSGSDLISVVGFAKKGILQKAQVEAFIVQSDGSLATTPSAAGITDDSGLFTLTPSIPKGNRYVLKVKATEQTVHVDELLGPQPLTGSFVLSAISPETNLSTVKAGDIVTINLTPFSHQEVVAAQKETGGLSTQNMSKAKAYVMDMYGFDPVKVQKDDKGLKIMLTAVSQMAKDGALGCSDAQDKTACVTAKLATAANTRTLKLELTGGIDVSNQFNTAVNQAVTMLAKNDNSFTLTNVSKLVSSLNCGNNCSTVASENAGSGGSGGGTSGNSAEALLISGVKTVLNEFTTDLRTMFSNDGVEAGSKGGLNQQAFKFQQAVQDVSLDLTQVANDAEAIALAVKLYQDAKSGIRYTATARQGDIQYGNAGFFAAAVGCTVFKDRERTIRAATPADSNFVSCVARYGRTMIAVSVTQEWYHAFLLVPKGSSGEFSYESVAANRLQNCATNPCTFTNTTLMSNEVFKGEIKTTKSLDLYTGITLTGELPPSFGVVNNTVVLAGDHDKHNWALNVSAKYDAGGLPEELKLNGSIVQLKNNQPVAQIVLREGSNINGPAMSMDLGLQVTSFTPNNTSALEGRFVMGDKKEDKGGKSMPTSMVFSGSLSNTMSNNKLEFLKGELSLTVSGLEKFDSRLPDSRSNSTTLRGKFTGSVSAPAQPRLEIVVETSGQSYNFDESLRSVNLSYGRYDGATKMRAINFEASRAVPGGPETVTLSEASSGLQISYLNGGNRTVDVSAKGTKIGVLDTAKSRFTFNDGSVTSLDIWP